MIAFRDNPQYDWCNKRVGMWEVFLPRGEPSELILNTIVQWYNKRVGMREVFLPRDEPSEIILNTIVQWYNKRIDRWCWEVYIKCKVVNRFFWTCRCRFMSNLLLKCVKVTDLQFKTICHKSSEQHFVIDLSMILMNGLKFNAHIWGRQ